MSALSYPKDMLPSSTISTFATTNWALANDDENEPYLVRATHTAYVMPRPLGLDSLSLTAKGSHPKVTQCHYSFHISHTKEPY
jgi:hypothetical protein